MGQNFERGRARDYWNVGLKGSLFHILRANSLPAKFPALHPLRFSMRLNRFLASAGLGSRRGVEGLITSGQVRINGQVITDPATQVAPNDAVKVGSRLLRTEQKITVLLNKPAGFLCTASDERDRKTIFQ